MEKKNTGKYWGLFAVAGVACLGILFSSHPEWFWVTLPFVLTGLVGGLDAI